jgi:hypothetical protein
MQARWLLAIVLVYAVAGLLLRAFAGIKILPPCLYTTLFHVHCPGCGITTATTLILQGRIADAWHTNPLAFPAIVIILAALIRDYFKFLRTFNQQ